MSDKSLTLGGRRCRQVKREKPEVTPGSSGSPVSVSPVNDSCDKDALRLQLLYLTAAAQAPSHWRTLTPSLWAHKPITQRGPTVATPRVRWERGGMLHS